MEYLIKSNKYSNLYKKEKWITGDGTKFTEFISNAITFTEEEKKRIEEAIERKEMENDLDLEFVVLSKELIRKGKIQLGELDEEIEKENEKLLKTIKGECDKKSFKLGVDRKGKKLEIGDICSFTINEREYRGIIVYEDSEFAFCFDMDSDFFPSVKMCRVDIGSIEKL